MSDIQREEEQREGKQRQKSSQSGEPKQGSGKGKSSQLKSMLGIQVSKGNTSAAQSNDTESSGADGRVWGSGSVSQSSAAKSLKDIQAEEAKQRLEREQVARDQSAQLLGASVAAAPKWNLGSGVSRVTKSSSQSLADIMQQEEQAKQLHGSAASSNEAPLRSAAPPAGSWAAKAAKGVPSSGSFSAVPMSPVKSTGVPAPAASKPVAAPKRDDDVVESFWNFSDKKTDDKQPSNNVRGDDVAKGSAVGTSNKPSSRSDSALGAVPTSLAVWCAAEIKKLNGSDDLTLIQFCYTLDSAVEIREYFAEYLGSTPQVSQFATEFIRRKEGKVQHSAPTSSVSNISVSQQLVAGTNNSIKKKKAVKQSISK